MLTVLTAAALALHLATPPDALPGRYALDARASDDHTAVVDEALRTVHRLKRGRMRSELLEQLRPTSSLTIRAEASGFVITDSAGRTVEVVPGAPATRIRTPRGESAEVSAIIRGDALVVRVQSPRALREQVFTANDTGLTVTSTYTIDALDAPLTLHSVYRRDVP